MMKIKSILFSIILLLGLQGCMTVPGVLETPQISVNDVALQNVSLTQGTALIRLNVTNPNAFPLPLRGVQYGLALNGRQVAQGQQSRGENIGAHATVPLDIPVQMNLNEVVALIPSVLGQRQLQYNLQGSVDLPLISIPFSRVGGVGVP